MIVVTVTTRREQALAESAMDRLVLRNPNLRGQVFCVELGERCAVDGIDEHVAAGLMGAVFQRPAEV